MPFWPVRLGPEKLVVKMVGRRQRPGCLQTSFRGYVLFLSLAARAAHTYPWSVTDWVTAILEFGHCERQWTTFKHLISVMSGQKDWKIKREFHNMMSGQWCQTWFDHPLLVFNLCCLRQVSKNHSGETTIADEESFLHEASVVMVWRFVVYSGNI